MIMLLLLPTSSKSSLLKPIITLIPCTISACLFERSRRFEAGDLGFSSLSLQPEFRPFSVPSVQLGPINEVSTHYLNGPPPVLAQQFVVLSSLKRSDAVISQCRPDSPYCFSLHHPPSKCPPLPSFSPMHV